MALTVVPGRGNATVDRNGGLDMRVLVVALAVMLSACAMEEAAQAPAASAANTSLATTYHSRGNAQFNARNYAAALADYDAALRLAPNFAGTLRNRCNTKIALNDLDGALADCEAALRLSPNDAFA